MKITLFHGRKSLDEDMNDWGFDGEVIEGISSLVWTYGTPRIYFTTEKDYQTALSKTNWEPMADGLEFRIFEDLIQTPTGFYGDWQLTE